MKSANPGTIGLRVQLTLIRFGLINCMATILCLVSLVMLVGWLPHLRGQLKIQQQNLTELESTAHANRTLTSTVAPPTTEQRRLDFYDALGDYKHSEQQIKTLFSIADKSGITLNLGEYHLTADANGHFSTYQIVLPVKGSYQQIRQLCEKTLMAIPFASLDEIAYKRDSINNPFLEARLRFTLYLNNGPSNATAISKELLQ